jgi:L-threonylcarbamoyladenylate synthase
MDEPTAEIAHAVEALRAGLLVAFPTETVYGLGADAANVDAVRGLYAVKGRPSDHPVIVHIARAAQLDDLALDVPDIARVLADAYWPGPLTIVVRRDPKRVVAEVTGGRETVGLRVPDHPVALELLTAFGSGVAAPSANRFGRVSPTTAAHVRADLGADVEAVLDGGPCRVGLESTIVDVTGTEPAILRLGGVSRAEIESVVGRTCALRTTIEGGAPGTLASHYSPLARVEVVEVDAVAARAREIVDRGQRVGLLSLAQIFQGLPDDLVVLRPPRDVGEFARVLYSRLREADDRELDVLVVVSPPGTDDLGAAIADRVWRASR